MGVGARGGEAKEVGGGVNEGAGRVYFILVEF